MGDRHWVVVDTETTGLYAGNHRPFEVAWWDLQTGERSLFYPRLRADELDRADPEALEVNGFWRRRIHELSPEVIDYTRRELRRFHTAISGHTLCGSKPSFDAGMLAVLFEEAALDTEPWHHHPLDLGAYAAGRLGLDEPLSARKVAERLSIAPGDHTAEGDVTSEGLCFQALAARPTLPADWPFSDALALEVRTWT
jgi:DNA polymerase-3 subunit epsilon